MLILGQVKLRLVYPAGLKKGPTGARNKKNYPIPLNF